MAVFFAVCDDNIAMRKQTERLLSREKDARLKSSGEVMYIESFGSFEALYKTPFKYDMFIIDVVSSSTNGLEIARSLRNMGISAAIVLLISNIDYRLYSNEADDFIYMEKPIVQSDISHLVDIASDTCSLRIPLMEIRCMNKTHFVNHKDILYAKPQKRNTIVLLKDGSLLTTSGSVEKFASYAAGYKCFIRCGKKYVNFHNVISVSMFYLTLENGSRLYFSPFKKHKLKQALDIFKFENVSQ